MEIQLQVLKATQQHLKQHFETFHIFTSVLSYLLSTTQQSKRKAVDIAGKNKRINSRGAYIGFYLGMKLVFVAH